MSPLKSFLAKPDKNFCIDIIDINAAAQTKNLNAILKYDSTPHQSYMPCTSNICIDDDQFDIAIATDY